MDKIEMNLLVRSAHDHAFEIASSPLKWDAEKSWVEFLKQNNLKKIDFLSLKEKKKLVLMLISEGKTIRQIAKQLGYKHPGSITYIITKRP